MKTDHCPTCQELVDFDLGNHSAARLEEISEHLEACPQCASILESLDEQEDEVLHRLREKLPAEIVEEDSQLNLLISAAAALLETSSNNQHDTLRSDSNTPPVSIKQVVAQVLHRRMLHPGGDQVVLLRIGLQGGEDGGGAAGFPRSSS